MDSFEGIVTEIRFQNEENGFCVASVVAGTREETVVGVLPFIAEGERVLVAGQWITHPNFGRQLKAERYEIIQPTKEDEIERFLGSGVIKGIGPTMAAAMVRVFREDTLHVLAERPHELARVPGIGKKRAAAIGESYAKQFEMREAMLFLSRYQVSPAYAMRIIKVYGRGTEQVLRHNPYRLTQEVSGIGFKLADRIALSMGFTVNDPNRIRAGIVYTLWEAANSNGHVYLPRRELVDSARGILQVSCEDVENELTALDILKQVYIEEGEDGQNVFNFSLHSAEMEVANRLYALASAAAGEGPVAGEEALAGFEAAHGIQYEGEQRRAILSALSEGVMVLTGGPGTGKTTVINAIIGLLQQKGLAVVLAAPTGRAAKRMTEATGEEAKTIHRLLEYGGGGDDANMLSFAKDEKNPLKADAIIVDEVSMVDLQLMRALLRAIAPGSRLVLVGDADQLPSVGAGNVLHDIISSGCLPVVRLSQVYRQAAESQIVTNAHRINQGEMPILRNKDTDFFFERKQRPQDVADTVVGLCQRRLPTFYQIDPIMDIQVLAPVKRSEAGVFALNTMLQAALNPPARTKKERRYGETLFREGDKVMQVKNNYQAEWRKFGAAQDDEGIGVFNGDVGRILSIEDGELTVLFDDDRRVVYDDTMLQDLELAYAVTIHKSQGSEFSTVVLALAPGPPRMMVRNLLYTAVTRAKQRVVLVGREETIAQMVANNHTFTRYTFLAQRIKERMEQGG